MTTPLNVLCVLRSGGIYHAGHVERLRKQVPGNVQMGCLTDVDLDIDGVWKIPLVHNWPGWWSKLELFRPDLTIPFAVYLDLDVTVTGDLRTLIRPDFTACRDFLKPDIINTSVMSWTLARPTEVYAAMARDPAKRVEYRRWPKLGDQSFLLDHARDKIGVFEPGLVRSYRAECVDGVPEGTVVVAYHGHPKPWEVEAA